MKKFIFRFWPFFIFILLYSGIFYKVFFHGFFPVPSDLLVSWFFPYSSGGWEGYSPWITHKEFIAADVVRQLFPWRDLSIDLFKQGIIPLWNPYAFSGTPLLANVQSAVFYPANIFFFLFNSKIAWSIYILIQPILAFCFMYMFTRSLRLSKYASLFASFAFGFIGYVAIWFELGVVGHSALWLPLILYGIHESVNKNVTKYLLFSTLGTASMLLAGHMQTAVYALLFSAFYAVVLTYHKDFLKNSSFIGLSLLMGIGISAIQLIPSIELLQHSARNSSESVSVFHRFQLPPEHLVTFFAPDFFGNPATGNFWGKDYGEFMGYTGIIAFFFALLGVAYKNRKMVYFLLSAIGISLLFAFPTSFSNFLSDFSIPVLGSGIPARSLFLVQFSLVLLSAYGVEEFMNTKKIPFSKIALLISIYIVLWAFIFAAPQFFKNASFLQHLPVTKKNLILPTAIMLSAITLFLLSLKVKEGKKIAFFLMMIIAAGEYHYFFNKFLPFAPLSYLYPEQPLISYLSKNTPPDRVYGYDIARIETNLSTRWRIFSPEGYDSLYIKRYGELLFASQKGRFSENIQRSDALFKDSMPKDDSYAKKMLLNVLGTKYVLDKDDLAKTNWEPQPWRFPNEQYQLIWQEKKWKVYENKDALPRAVVLYDAEVITQDSKIIQRLFDKDFLYTKKIILEEMPPDMQLIKNQNYTKATITELSPNKTVIRADVKAKGLLFLSDVYYPGWKATVNDQEAKIYRANYAFRAVVIPPGKSTITFTYDPDSFRYGVITSGISSVIVLGFFGILSTSKRKKK